MYTFNSCVYNYPFIIFNSRNKKHAVQTHLNIKRQLIEKLTCNKQDRKHTLSFFFFWFYGELRTNLIGAATYWREIFLYS